ncbi:hypothetical protein AB3G45_12460 [Shinella sp. S4-D37]|uniref:hypothetical protein n=1 Tax=Shinella sp. S4-D37 TaxID=3161999 RepID=UPI00346688F0
MEKNLATTLLGAMMNCEDRGDFETMRGHLEYSGQEVATSGDLETVREFAKLLMRVIKAIDEESRLGRGSLLKLDHPHNIEWSNSRGFEFKMVNSNLIDHRQ